MNHRFQIIEAAGRVYRLDRDTGECAALVERRTEDRRTGALESSFEFVPVEEPDEEPPEEEPSEDD